MDEEVWERDEPGMRAIMIVHNTDNIENLPDYDMSLVRSLAALCGLERPLGVPRHVFVLQKFRGLGPSHWLDVDVQNAYQYASTSDRKGREDL
jgi:hypothetical protein